MYGGVHELTNLIDSIASVRSGESEVLKGAYNATILCCIRERSTIVCSSALSGVWDMTWWSLAYECK